MPNVTKEGSCGHRRGEIFVSGWLEIAAVDEPYDDELQGTFLVGSESSRALSLFEVGVHWEGLSLDSSNFIFIFAFQGGIIHQVSQLFLRLILHYVKLALDRNCGA